MSEILLVGAGPVVDAATTMTCSYNLRTAKLALWLRGEGLPFRLAAVDLFGAATRPVEIRGSLAGEYELFAKDGAGREALARRIRELNPRAILAVSHEAAARVCEIEPACPVWADMPGWIMAEAQLKAAAAGDDVFLEHFAQCEAAVLRRADVISVVSLNQRHATLGELALLGRLSRRNVAHPLVQVLPSLAHDWRPLLAAADAPSFPVAEPAIPPGEPVILWSGSYNLWSDAERIADLVEALLHAMPNLHFVSTGGHLPSHDDGLQGAFLARAAAADCRERFHILPWLPFGRAIQWLERADLGLCIDGVNLEIAYGSRTRVVDMLAHGLPVAATAGTELVSDLAQAGALIGLDPAEPEGWAEAIIPFLRSPERLRRLALRGRKYVYAHYGLPTVGRALREWLIQPRRAPDLVFLERVAAGLPPGVARPGEVSPPQQDPPMVTWVPQSRIEALARQVLDPFPPSGKSLALQRIFRRLLASRVAWWPALAAWRLAARTLPPLAAARWQSRVDQWNEAHGHPTGARQWASRVGGAVYGRALARCGEPGPARAVNILLARHDYDRAAGLRCLPQRIEVEASSACNLQCRMCKLPLQHKAGVHMTRELFNRIAPALKTAALLEFIGEGEPTLNPELPALLSMAARYDCPMRLFTNGTALTPELAAAVVSARVGRLVFSVCAGDREAYRRVTGADLLERVLNHARDLREVKRELGSALPRAGLNCPLIAETLERAPELVRLAGGLGLEWIGFGVALIFRKEMEGESILKADPEKVRAVFARCAEAGRRCGIHVILPPLDGLAGDAPAGDAVRNRFGCLYPWQSVRITAEGIVESCTYNRKIIGDLKANTLAEIWNGAEASRFRAGEVECEGGDQCAICYHRGYRTGQYRPEQVFPFIAPY